MFLTSKITFLICSDISIFIGNDLLSYEDNTIKFYSLNGTTYTDDDKQKTLGVTWFNKSEDNEYLGFSDGVECVKYVDDILSPYNPELYGTVPLVAYQRYQEEDYIRWYTLKDLEIKYCEKGLSYDNEEYSITAQNLV